VGTAVTRSRTYAGGWRERREIVTEAVHDEERARLEAAYLAAREKARPEVVAECDRRRAESRAYGELVRRVEAAMREVWPDAPESTLFALLASVAVTELEPTIRARVAEEIARALEAADSQINGAGAAAIAREHATRKEESSNGD
jgi:hypothetical protein